MMQHDPMLLFSKHLHEQLGVPEADLEAMDKDVIAQVDDAVQFAEESPWPSPDDPLRGRLRALALHPRAGRREGPGLARGGEGRPGPRGVPGLEQAEVES